MRQVGVRNEDESGEKNLVHGGGLSFQPLVVYMTVQSRAIHKLFKHDDLGASGDGYAVSIKNSHGVLIS